MNQAYETDVNFPAETLNRHFRFAPVVFYISRPTGPATYISPNASEILGFEPAAFTSQDDFWSSHIHPDDAPEILLAFKKLTDADHLILEYRFKNSDGEYRWIHDELDLARNPDGTPDFISGYWLDITERKLQEIALREAKQKLEEKDRFLQHVLDNIPQRMFWMDRSGVFIGCNRAGAKSLGLGSPDEIIGKTDFDLYPNREDSDYFFRLDQGVMEKDAALLHQLMQRQLPDGTMAWLDITKVPLHDDTGQVNGLLISHEDRTEFAAIETSLRKFKQAVEQSSNSIMITDVEGNLEYVNPNFCRTYGYEPHEILGSNPRLIKTGHTSPQEYLDMWQRLLAGQNWHGEFHNRKRDGGTVWQSAAISPILNDKGEISNFLSIGSDISEHKKAETTLKESEERFRAIADYTCNWENWVSPEGRLLWANPAMEQMTGYSMEECRAMPDFPLPLIHPDDRDKVAADFARAVCSRGGGSNIEFRSVRKDGSLFFADVSWQPIYDSSGKHLGHRSSVRDISAQTQAREELFATRHMLQRVLDHIPQRVFWKDLNSSYLGCNRAYSNDIGLASPAEIKGKTDFDHHTAKMARRYRKDDKHVIRHGQPKLGYEEPMETINGGIRWLQTSKVPLHGNAGEVIGVLGMYTDISEQKNLQKQLNDAIQQQQTILDNAQVSIVHLEERRFVWINRQMEEMFGYKKKEIQEKTAEIFHPSHEDYEQLDNEAYPILSQGKPFETERIMRRKNGRLFWCHLRGSAINPRNPRKGSIWTLMDIDRRKQAERELIELNNTLAQQVSLEIRNGMEKERILIQQARHAAMGEMIGNIAHQWRQPLTVLGLILQNISSDFEDHCLDTDTLKDYTAKAMRSIQQMSGTIDDFRDFFRPNREKAFFNMTQATQETLNLVEAALNNNNIACRLAGPEDIQCCGHKNELAQVLLNLINNAKDALVERKIPQGHIDIVISLDESRVRITVSDNAGGIQTEDAEKIFDPYFTTKEKGTGIGLYMAKTIIERHMGGNISFRNIDKGAEFTIEMPQDMPAAPLNQSLEAP